MDPNAPDSPEWLHPSPNRPATFVPRAEDGPGIPPAPQPIPQPEWQSGQHPDGTPPPSPASTPRAVPQQPSPAQPQAPVPMPASQSDGQQPAPDKKRAANTKPLVIAGIAAGAILIVGTALAVFWPKKQPPAPAPAVSTVAKYYYVESVQSPSGAAPYAYTIGQTDPAANTTAKGTLTTAQALIADTPPGLNNPLRFSADGTRYAYATSDLSGTKDHTKATADDYKIIAGSWPQKQSAERVLYTETKRNDSRDWLLTQDGKELIYLDIVLDGTTVTTSDLYTVDAATGKSTKIGAIDRPAARENTPLIEVTKDSSVRFYTSQDDGIYETKYDRKAHTLSNKKVVIRDYDPGTIGTISPDGTKMLFYGVSKTDRTVYLLDLVEGGSTPLISTPAAYGGYSSGIWSPDNKTVALSASIKDIDGQHYENQMLLIDTVVRTTANNIFLRNKSPGTDNSASSYQTTSWSPDGKYLTYAQNGQLYFYGLTHNQTVDSLKIPRDAASPNSLIQGWTVTEKQ